VVCSCCCNHKEIKQQAIYKRELYSSTFVMQANTVPEQFSVYSLPFTVAARATDVPYKNTGAATENWKQKTGN
jgi:hypothetical protein